MTTGRGHTHYIAYFGHGAGNGRTAVCGIVTPSCLFSTEPTCPECCAWMERDEAMCADLMADEPDGEPWDRPKMGGAL